MEEKKVSLELSKEEVEALISKLITNENVNLAVQVRDGEERIMMAERLKKLLVKSV